MEILFFSKSSSSAGVSCARRGRNGSRRELRMEGDMGPSKERRRVGSTMREAKTQKLVLTVLAVLAVSPIILLSLYTVPEDNYRGGEMYSTPKLRQAYEVVNAFEYPMDAGMVAEPCAPGKPLLNVILSGVDPHVAGPRQNGICLVYLSSVL